MTFAELLETGRKMSGEELKNNLKSLSTDARFPALLGLLQARTATFQRSVSAPKAAGDHGTIAHVAGGLFENLNLLDTLKEIIEPSPRRTAPPPEE